MDKQGVGRRMTFVVFLFLLLIVGAGIVFGVLVFFGGGYDARQGEAATLNFLLQRCISNNKINFATDDVLSLCGLNTTILNNGNYKINICKDQCIENNPGIFSVGSNFLACQLSDKADSYPKCVREYIVKNGQNYEILVGSIQFYSRRNA